MVSFSRLFTQTLHDAPAEAETPGYQFLLRAGYITSAGNANHIALPLASLCLDKLQQYLVQAIRQSNTFPVHFPSTSNYVEDDFSQLYGAVNKVIRSHRQLPVTIYHLASTQNHSPRPKVGLLDSRESSCFRFSSLSTASPEQQEHFRKHKTILQEFFNFCLLDVQTAVDNQSAIGKTSTFFLPFPSGEDTYIQCEQCGATQPLETARFHRPQGPASEMLPVTPVPTPNASSIQELAAYLKIPTSQTAKAVFWMATLPQRAQPVFLFLVVRGDMEVSPGKVKSILACEDIRPATEEEIRSIGAEPGYASPIGIAANENLLVCVDESIPLSPNLVAGANRTGYHLLHTNYARDYSAQVIADIALASEGSACPECHAPLHLVNGVEVAVVHQSQTEDCAYQDAAGQNQPILFTNTQINLTRVLGCLAEVHHDQSGLTFPAAIAPYPVHIIVLAGKTVDTAALAIEICDQLQKSHIETLIDDRTESAGVKFNDADLIGLPIRITISERALQAGGIEYKLRTVTEKTIVPVANLIQQIQKDLAAG